MITGLHYKKILDEFEKYCGRKVEIWENLQ